MSFTHRLVSGIAVVVSCIIALPLTADADSLVQDRQPAGSIVVPANATKAEQFAAEELQRYVERMTGAQLSIDQTDTLPDTPAIIVGRHATSHDLINRLDKLHPDTPEAIALESDGNKLRLVGRSGTATIWATWEWLETLGVQWLMPGPHGDYVPALETISTDMETIISAPRFAFRGPNYWMPDTEDAPPGFFSDEHGMPAYKLFSLRMRMNQNLAFDDADTFANLGSGHSYQYYLPVDRYYAEHPEWFNLRNGVRQNTGDWQVCFTNKDAAAEFAKNVINELPRWTSLGVPLSRLRICISPNDGVAVCECPNCAKIRDSDGSTTSMVTEFANNVIAEIRKTHPDAWGIYFAYNNYSTPPEHVDPAPGIAVELTAWTASHSFGVNHAKPLMSDANARFRNAFDRYAEISDGVSAYTYYGHYTLFTPFPVTTQMAHDIKAWAKYPKFYGLYSESHVHWATQGLTFWLQPKLMWNPDLNVRKAISEYCAAAYGPAAQPMERYFGTLQAQMDSLGTLVGVVNEIPAILTLDVITKCDNYMNAAESKLDQMDPAMRWRTELAIAGWRNSVKVAKAVQLFNQSRNPQDRQKILTLLAEVDEFSKSDMGRWAFERRIVPPVIDPIIASLTTDLNSLPPGDFSYYDDCLNGGATKFYATAAGVQLGTWGFDLPANAKGTIELPIQATAGSSIVALSTQWQFGTDQLQVALSVVTPDGSKTTLSTDMNQIRRGIEIPQNLVGQPGVVVLMELHNPQNVTVAAITRVQVSGTVN